MDLVYTPHHDKNLIKSGWLWVDHDGDNNSRDSIALVEFTPEAYDKNNQLNQDLLRALITWAAHELKTLEYLDAYSAGYTMGRDKQSEWEQRFRTNLARQRNRHHVKTETLTVPIDDAMLDQINHGIEEENDEKD